jgi:hypothetical protein
MKTPDTSMITGKTLALMRQHNLKAEQVMFDAGGGGRQHADRLRSQGFAVRTVAFGEGVAIVEPKRAGVVTPFGEKVERREDRQFLFNRRAEMYWDLSQAGNEPSIYAVPREMAELHRQLSLIPKVYDDEGRLKLPPKGNLSELEKRQGKLTLIEIVGCSPDHADAAVVCYYCMTHEPKKQRAGAI